MMQNISCNTYESDELYSLCLARESKWPQLGTQASAFNKIYIILIGSVELFLILTSMIITNNKVTAISKY